jgi:AraC-like DNA-binding protein
MDLLALLPKALRRGTHMICRTAPRAGFVACGFIHHRARRDASAEPEPAPNGRYGLSLAIVGTATYRDRHGARHPVRPGTIFQFSDPPGGVIGTVEPEPGFFEVTVSFSDRIGARLAEIGMWKDAFVCAATEPSAALLQRYLELHQRMVASPITYESALRAIVPILDLAYAHAATIGDDQRLMAEACRLLGAGDDPRYDAHRAARDLGLPYETFRKLFNRHVGLSPHAYLLRERMRRASGWLGSSSVKEVAARLGYSNPFVFSRLFKKVMGVPPKTFKG